MQVDEETSSYKETLAYFERVEPTEWEGGVALLRNELSEGFFDFLTSIIDACHKDEARQKGVWQAWAACASIWRCPQ